MQALEKMMEGSSQVEHQVEQLQQDLLVSEKERSQAVAKLFKAEQHIEVLTATVDTLSAVSNVQTDWRCCAAGGYSVYLNTVVLHLKVEIFKILLETPYNLFCLLLHIPPVYVVFTELRIAWRTA